MLENCPDCNNVWNKDTTEVSFRNDKRWGQLRIEKCKKCGYENY